MLIIAVPLLTILAIIVFVLTQDMNLRMVLVDWWTIAHITIFIASMVCYIYAIRRKYDREEDEYYDGQYAYDSSTL